MCKRRRPLEPEGLAEEEAAVEEGECVADAAGGLAEDKCCLIVGGWSQLLSGGSNISFRPHKYCPSNRNLILITGLVVDWFDSICRGGSVERL